MTLEDAIYNSILTFPSLYYKDSIKESRRAVLCHYFLTIGNGIELAYTKDKTKGGYFTSPNFYKKNGEWERKYDKPYGHGKVSQEIKDRINAGEKLGQIRNVNQDYLKFGNIIGESSIGEEREVYKWLVDIKEDYPYQWSKTEKGKTYTKCIDVEPYKHSWEEKYNWKPYPLSFGYLPCVEINPNYSKYNYETIHNMTVEELSESKALIKPDWIAGIVEIITDALNWFESDAFMQDDYFNWSISKRDVGGFPAKFEKAKTENFEKFCNDYKIPVENYETWQDFALACVNKSRKRYIEDCKKVIAALS